MKLGEALSLRARQAQKLNDLRGRIRTNAMTQEGDAPAEDPNELLREFALLSEEHSQLLRRIALTNQQTTLADDRVLADLLQEREHLRRTRNMTEAAATAATPSRSDYRYGRTEIKYVPQLRVAALRTAIEDLDTQVRKLDATIQEANWQADLL